MNASSRSADDSRDPASRKKSDEKDTEAEPSASLVERLMGLRTWVEIDLGAFCRNIRLIRERIGPARLLVAVKKDAYGHGLIPTARAARECGADYLGVACIGEALALRSAGIASPILDFGLALDEEIESAVAAAIDLTVATLEDARRISKAAGKVGRPARVHLKIDTGMGRLGLFPEQLADEVDGMASLPNLEWVGLYSHLADSTGNPDLTEKQLDRFERVGRALAGWLDFKHLGASGAIENPRLHFDMLRVGIAAYGAEPLLPQLEPVMALKSRIIFIKDFPPGATVSYGATYVTKEPTRVGVVAAGYGNGYPRQVSNRGHVLVGGRPAPIIGRICMDQFMINLNDLPEAEVGDTVLLFGRDEHGLLPVAQVAQWADTISYEILCCVGAMNRKIYRRSASPGGKSATGAV